MTSRKYKIGELGKVVTGKTPSTGNPDYWGGMFPFITIPDLNDLPYVEHSLRTLSQSGAIAIKSQMLPENSVLMSCIATIGKCGITTRPSFTNQQINAVIPNNKINPLFLLYLFRNLGSEMTKYGSVGTVYTNISKSLFESIEVQIPESLVAQSAIAKVLAALDAKIAVNASLSKTLEDIAQTIFKSWFIDFDPVKAKLAGEKPKGMDAATAELFPHSMEESELGLIPKGWEVKGVGDFGKVVTGKTPSTKVPEYWGDQIPFVTIPDMHGQILITSTVRALSQKGADSQRSQNVSAGSTMVTCIATPGLVSYATKLCQTNQQINSVVPGNEYSSIWLFWHLRGLIPTLIRNSGIGTVFANLNKSDFSKIKSVTPTRAVRDAFSGMVQPIVELLETLNYESQCLRDIRDGMLPRLISGELKIPDEMLVS